MTRYTVPHDAILEPFTIVQTRRSAQLPPELIGVVVRPSGYGAWIVDVGMVDRRVLPMDAPRNLWELRVEHIEFVLSEFPPEERSGPRHFRPEVGPVEPSIRHSRRLQEKLDRLRFDHRRAKRRA
jgi:hypothetical protein